MMPLRVLIVAYHFPPIKGSSGFLRTLKFVRYIRDFDIEPVVLTVHPRAYPDTDAQLLGQIPEGVLVKRSFALDVARHFSFAGSYPSFLAVPDRFASWIPMGVRDGTALVRRLGIQAIFSTYPVPSAHVIAGRIARKTGVPWIADFRDPMWDDFLEIPASALEARKRVEAETVERSTHILATTAGIAELFHRRYPSLPEGRMTVIPNGYDEFDFANLAKPDRKPDGSGPIVLIHAGLLEQVDRDPVPFLRGLRLAMDKGWVAEPDIRVRLLGSGNLDVYLAEVERLSLGKCVTFESSIPYGRALELMAASDILLLFQGPSCEAQIPAKLYEYLRVGKPILALTTVAGETGRLVLASDAGTVVPIDDPEAIAQALGDWTGRLRRGDPLPHASKETAGRYSRQKQAGELAGLIRKVVEAEKAPAGHRP